MPRANTASTGQILLFPNYRSAEEDKTAIVPGRSVVLCGTYRKDPEGLRRTFERLTDSGFSILSPSNPFIETEEHGFVYMRHENVRSPEQIESRHLDAIQKADFVWFFAPEGYVGPTGALEVGFARANGIPVYSDTPLTDVTIKSFVQIVESPSSINDYFTRDRVRPPAPAVRTFQNYYRRVAIQRGYTHENAKDCLMLMVEEIGELARALRKRAKLVRHGKGIQNQEEAELADVFIYVVHMANILKVDLSTIVQAKEIANIQKFPHGG